MTIVGIKLTVIATREKIRWFTQRKRLDLDRFNVVLLSLYRLYYIHTPADIYTGINIHPKARIRKIT